MRQQVIRGFTASIHKKLLLRLSSGTFDTDIPISSLLGMKHGENLKLGPCTAHANNGDILLTLFVQRSEVKVIIPRISLRLL